MDALIQSIPSLLKNIAPGQILPASDCHPASSGSESSKVHFIVPASQLLQDGGKHGTTMNSTIMGSLLYFICFQMHCLIRGNTVWDTMPMGEAFYKSKDSRFSRSTVCREGKYISRASVYYGKKKTNTSSSTMKVVQYNQPATR